MINEDNVQEYCRHTKELKQTQVSKALKLIKYKCIQYLGNVADDTRFKHIKDKYENMKNAFVCLPLNINDEHIFFNITIKKEPYPKNYNFSEYLIYKNNNTFECNCQGWQTKKKRNEIIDGGANCSHVLALYYYFRLRPYNLKEV